MAGSRLSQLSCKNLKPEPETPDTDTLPPEFLEHTDVKQEHQPALTVGEDAP